MKKTLLIACLLLATTSVSYAATTKPTCPCNNQPQRQQMQRPPKRPDFDAQLNLTTAQKAKAKQIRQQGHAQMKPIMDKLISKEEQKRMLMQNKNPGTKEVNKLNSLNKEINALRKKADTIRERNNKQFEAILTSEQKKKFEQIKKQGRREFGKNHPPMPFGAPGMGPEGQGHNGHGHQPGDFPPPPPPRD